MEIEPAYAPSFSVTLERSKGSVLFGNPLLGKAVKEMYDSAEEENR